MDAIVTWWNEGRPLVSRWTHTKNGCGLTWVGHTANLYHTWTRWIRPRFWLGIFAKRDDSGVSRRTVVWCRLRGHPPGSIYYNPGGFEPDDRCAGCLEDLSYGPSPQWITRQSLQGLREAVKR